MACLGLFPLDRMGVWWFSVARNSDLNIADRRRRGWVARRGVDLVFDQRLDRVGAPSTSGRQVEN